MKLQSHNIRLERLSIIRLSFSFQLCVTLKNIFQSFLIFFNLFLFVTYLVFFSLKISMNLSSLPGLVSAPLSHFPTYRSVLRGLYQWKTLSKVPSLHAKLQKGGVPATPSGTATLLRLSPNYRFHPRPILSVSDFRRSQLSWLDGRCVQGPGTYSPRHG